MFKKIILKIITSEANNTLPKEHEKIANTLGTILNIIGGIFVFLLIFNTVYTFKFNKPIGEWVAACANFKSSTNIDISDKLGPFGDFIGGVFNPILSFFTLLGLCITIILQRIEMTNSRKDAKEQEKTNQLQNHLNVFYNSINVHQNITNTLVFTTEENYLIREIRVLAGLDPTTSDSNIPSTDNTRTSVNGRSVFRIVLSKISHNNETKPEIIAEKYRLEIQKDQNQILGHYFRNLYHALRIIDEISTDLISQKEKKTRYTNLLRAQLSSYELCVLFLNCLEGVVDSGEFRELLIKYEILEHIPLYQEGPDFRVKGIDIILANERMQKYFIDEKGNSAYGKNKFTR